MIQSPISIARRHVLGDLYNRCDKVVSVPVYMDGAEDEVAGYVDEGLGEYADAFSFHLPDEICKNLSTGKYIYSFNYNFSEADDLPASKRRITLTAIRLTLRPHIEPRYPRKKVEEETADVLHVIGG